MILKATLGNMKLHANQHTNAHQTQPETQPETKTAPKTEAVQLLKEHEKFFTTHTNPSHSTIQKFK